MSMKDGVIRRVEVGGGIAVVHRSRAFEKKARAFAKPNAIRAMDRASAALDDGRLVGARMWLRYAATSLSLLAPRTMRPLCAEWLGFVLRLAELSQVKP